MTDADALREIGKLRTALKPFADQIGNIDESDPDGWDIWEHACAINIKIGDIRAAHKAYEGKT